MKHWIMVFMLAFLCSEVSTLDCIQCDKNAAWYSEEEHERHIELCQNGLIRPAPCHNKSHTHCIVSWYRSGGSKGKIHDKYHCKAPLIIVFRKHRHKFRNICKYVTFQVRHLITKEQKDMRKETTTLFVEVCSESCPGGECINGAQMPIIIAVILLTTILLARCCNILYMNFYATYPQLFPHYGVVFRFALFHVTLSLVVRKFAWSQYTVLIMVMERSSVCMI
uniref:RING-CH-type domain-containing protein n=1 Tax=Heterorhabditis bacteriophora TaxID=37862 RepID=A0A1I7XHS3_HETBA